MKSKDQQLLEEAYVKILDKRQSGTIQENIFSKLNPFKKKKAEPEETEQPKQMSHYQSLENFTEVLVKSLQKKYPTIKVQDFAKADPYHGDDYNSFAVYLNGKAILEIKPNSNQINDFKTETKLSSDYHSATYEIIAHLEDAGIEFDKDTDYWRALHNPSALHPSNPWR